MISRKDFDNWRLDPVTIAFMEACQYRIEDSKEMLVSSAGLDPNYDNFLRGFITAYNEIKEFKVDELEDN